MHILNVLKQLRDDLKALISVNINNLNKKIDRKSQARFSREYQDLYNAPHIVEDNQEELAVVDESGNIVFKVDKDGVHTTNLTLKDGEVVSKEFVEQAISAIPQADLSKYPTKDELNQALDNINLTGYATEDYVRHEVTSLVNSAPEALDTLGELASALNNHEDAYDSLLEVVGQKATQKQLEELEKSLGDGIESNNEEYNIVDSEGNIILRVDKNGLETTAVKTKTLTVDGKTLEDTLAPFATSDEVTEAIKNIDIPKVDFTGYATEDYVDQAIDNIPDVDLTGYATETYVKNKIAEAQLDGGGNTEIDLSGLVTKDEIKDFIKEIPEEYIKEDELNEELAKLQQGINEGISSSAEDLQISDSEGYVIAKINNEGIHTVALTLDGKPAATQEFVENAIDNINIPEVDFTGYATEDYVDQAIKDIDIPKVDLTGYATEDYVDQAIKDIDILEMDLTNYVTKDEVTDFVKEDKLDEELAKLQKSFNEGISSEAEDLQISDDEGNVIVRIDAEGIHTVALTLHEKPVATEEFVEAAIESIDISNVDLTGYATEDYVKQEIATLVNSAPETLNTLGELATAIEDNGDAISALEKIAAGKASQTDLNKTNQEVTAVKNLVGTSSVQSQINKALDKLDVVFSGDYRDLINAPNINEDGSGDMVVTDDAGHVAFKVDSDGGTHVTSLSINGTMLDSILASKVERNEITLTGLGLTYGKYDLTPGTSELPTGHFYFVYE